MELKSKDKLSLKNTLTGKLDLFEPINREPVGLYHCGPTVYAPAHIGNLRPYVVADVLRRTLEFRGYEVKQVINVTDVGHLSSDADFGDDKMTKALREKNLPINLENMKSVGHQYADIFFSDLKFLNIKEPTVTPFASDHIKEDLEIIKNLEKNGFVYKISDGLYFDTEKFEEKYPGEYGRLGNVNLAKLQSGARIKENSEKKNQSDFALWKFNDDLGYESEYGKGFPGWHLECSAMSRKYLGQPFDIHTGGVDHIGTHHNNEIAQSKGAYDIDLAKYWMHNAHITMNGKKISKSTGNYLTLEDLTKQGIHPLSYRFWLLQGHYSRPMDFSIEVIHGAQSGLEELIRKIDLLEFSPEDGSGDQAVWIEAFEKVIFNDLDTPNAISLIYDVLADKKSSSATRIELVKIMSGVLGLGLFSLLEDIKDSEIGVLDKQEEYNRKYQEAVLNKTDYPDDFRQELEDKFGMVISTTIKKPDDNQPYFYFKRKNVLEYLTKQIKF